MSYSEQIIKAFQEGTGVFYLDQSQWNLAYKTQKENKEIKQFHAMATKHPQKSSVDSNGVQWDERLYIRIVVGKGCPKVVRVD